MSEPTDKQLELEQQAVGRAILMLVLASAFLYFRAPGWSIFASVIGLGWLAQSAMKPD